MLLPLPSYRWDGGTTTPSSPRTNPVPAVPLPGNSSPPQAGALCSPSLLLSLFMCLSLSPAQLRCCPCPLPFQPPPLGAGVGTLPNRCGESRCPQRVPRPFTPSSPHRCSGFREQEGLSVLFLLYGLSRAFGGVVGVSSVAIQDYKGNTFNHYSLESRIATWSQMLSTLFFFF